MKTTRRSFLTFLAALAPGLALARAGLGGWVAAPAVFQGLDAWLPYAGTPPEFFGTYRQMAVIYATVPGYNAVIHLGDGSEDVS